MFILFFQSTEFEVYLVLIRLVRVLLIVQTRLKLVCYTGGVKENI